LSPNPVSFLNHVKSVGYHPRSNKHSNCLGEAIVTDLVEHCPAIADKAKAGRIVYALNFQLRVGTADWNVDLVLGAPELGMKLTARDLPIANRHPSTVEIAIEIKSVMTEHRKAVKNRKRDLEAHHEHVHHYKSTAIAGGVLVINGSKRFRSPLRPAATVHSNPIKLVEHCLNELRAVTLRQGHKGVGLDARCAIVVDVDNEDLESARFITKPPAPQVGDPLHYDAFIQSICNQYTERFG
jgi:hypothetical protein